MITDKLQLLAVAFAGSAITLVLSVGIGALADGNPTTDSVPRVIAYEGYLEKDGAPLAATGVDMAFTLFDGTGPSAPAVFSQSIPQVKVYRGRFSVTLGPTDDTSRSLATVVAAADDLYVGVTLVGAGDGGADVPLAGRQRLVSTPYSMWSATASHFTVAGNLDVGQSANVSQSVNVGQNLTVGQTLTTGSVVGPGSVGNRTVNLADNLNVGQTLITGSVLGPGSAGSRMVNLADNLNVSGRIKGGGTLAGLWQAAPTGYVSTNSTSWASVAALSFTLDRPATIYATYAMSVQPNSPPLNELVKTILRVDTNVYARSASHYQPFCGTLSGSDCNVTLTGDLVVTLNAGAHTVDLLWAKEYGGVVFSNDPSWCSGTCAPRTITVMAFYQ